MIAALTLLCIATSLAAAAMFIFARAARAEAERVAADAGRLHTIIDGLLTVTPEGPEPIWHVTHRGATVARGHDLAVLIDEVNIYG